MRSRRWTTLQAIALLFACAASISAQDPPPPATAPPVQTGTDGQVAPLSRPPVRVSLNGQVRPPRKIKDAKPVFPADAQAKKISGIVIMEATIDESGKVRDVKVQRSVPELDQAAVDAVKQWEFTPTLVDGVPTPVIMNVTVNFTLSSGPISSAIPPPGSMEERALRTGPPVLGLARIAGDLPSYPSKVKDNARGTILLAVTLDDKGRVREVRTISDQREVSVAPLQGRATNTPLGKPFVDAAVKAVKTWRYPTPGPLPVVCFVRFHFVPGQPVEAT